MNQRSRAMLQALSGAVGAPPEETLDALMSWLGKRYHAQAPSAKAFRKTALCIELKGEVDLGRPFPPEPASCGKKKKAKWGE